MPEPGAGTARFLTFRVDRTLYALPAGEVAEIIRMPAMARVPQSPPGLLGMANLRGAVLPVASLRALLGRPEMRETGNEAARAIVLDGAAPVALAVDLVDALVSLEASRVETRPAELAAAPGERLRGAFPAPDGVARILDVRALLADAFVQRASARRTRAPMQGGAIAGGGTGDATSRADEQMLVSFEVAGQDYALELDAVQEIMLPPEALTRMPHAEALVLGMTAFRDGLLPLLSLRGLLGFAPDGTGREAGREKVIVTRVAGAQAGLVADRMRAILRADRRAIEAIPPVLAARSGGEARIKAIYRGAGGRLVSLLAPEQLFREDIMQRMGEQASAPLPAGPAAETQVELRFLVFRLGEEEFGLPIDAVDRVERVPAQVTRIPKTPKFLEGVVNLHGEVLPVIEQRRRFDLPAFTGDRQRQRLVVVRSERHRAGLIVDSVSEVLRATADDVEPAPDLTGESTRLVHGVINLTQSKRLVLLLDPAELLSRSERRLLDAFQATAAAAPTPRAEP